MFHVRSSLYSLSKQNNFPDTITEAIWQTQSQYRDSASFSVNTKGKTGCPYSNLQAMPTDRNHKNKYKSKINTILRWSFIFFHYIQIRKTPIMSAVLLSLYIIRLDVPVVVHFKLSVRPLRKSRKPQTDVPNASTFTLVNFFAIYSKGRHGRPKSWFSSFSTW